MKFARIFVSAFLFAAALPAFSAPVTYILGDHDDGGLYNGSTSGPNGPYGLRLDLIDPPAGNGPTFSVGDNLGGNGGLMTLTYDAADLGAGATIAGSMYRNDLGGTWTVNYVLTDLSSDGNGGFIAQTGVGTAVEDAGPGFVDLIGKSDGTGVFIFSDDGHRLDTSDGLVGRGWIEGNGTNDWLVTAAIPVPGAVWLMGSALGLLGWMRRKPKV